MSNKETTASPQRTPSRRGFLRELAASVIVLWDEINGHPQLNMMELPNMSAADMGAIRPRIMDEVSILVGETHIKATLPPKKEERELFLIQPANLFAFNLFNGLFSIHQIAGRLAEFMDWEWEESFQHTRGLFLHLVQAGVCVPGNGTEEDEGGD